MKPDPGGFLTSSLELARLYGLLALAFLVALGLSLVVERSSLFYHVDRWLTDTTHGLTAPRIRFKDVLIVDVDEKSLVTLEPRYGSWPYDRDLFALATDHLKALGANSIVFNIIFADERDGDGEFAAALAKPPGAWMAGQGQAYAMNEDPAYRQRLGALAWKSTRPVPSLGWRSFRLPSATLTGDRPAKVGVGIVSITPDDDGMLRRAPLLQEAGGNYLPALPLGALFKANDRPEVRVTKSSIQVGGHTWPVDDEGNINLRVPGNIDMFEGISFVDVVRSATGDADFRLDRALVEGRTIFVGSTAAILGDYAHIPIHGRMAGLDIFTLVHVNLSNNLVLVPRSVLWKVLFCLLSAAIPLVVASRPRVSDWQIPVIFGLGLFAAAGLHLVLLGYYGRQSALLFPILLSAFTLLGQTSIRVRTLYVERRRFFLDKLAADEASSLKSQFLSHMTHELRTPLTAIMGYNRLLMESDLSEQEKKTQGEIIDKNCHHLLALINNLLDQAKIDAGQMSLEIASVSVSDLMESVADLLHPIADQKGLKLECRVADDVPSGVRVDETRVLQILINLGGNAVKFTNTGGVTIDVEWADGWLQIRVSDTGVGMDPGALEEIFEAFRQADVSVARRHGGTGLGLTISRNLARLMGGDIDVASEEEKGSTFTLRIPAEGFEYPLRPRVAVDEEEGSLKLKGRVLVADDTADLRHLLSLYLKKVGLDVLLAENGREAVDLALSEKPDLIFMDIQMPVMDGLEAVKALRDTGYSGTILALTAQSERARIEATLAAGCDGYVEKPLRPEYLIEIVRGRLADAGGSAGT
jgi:signal transduction histidine kinase/CheY-like chemotaxis protein